MNKSYLNAKELKADLSNLDESLPVWRGEDGSYIVCAWGDFTIEQEDDETEYVEAGTVAEWLEVINA